MPTSTKSINTIFFTKSSTSKTVTRSKLWNSPIKMLWKKLRTISISLNQTSKPRSKRKLRGRNPKMMKTMASLSLSQAGKKPRWSLETLENDRLSRFKTSSKNRASTVKISFWRSSSNFAVPTPLIGLTTQTGPFPIHHSTKGLI